MDLDYPPELHLPHNSFPMAPESVTIDESMLSPYSSLCLERVYGKRKYSSKKLTATFHSRRKYVVHGLNLLFYLQQGLQLTKIHRIVGFHQEDFIAPYIDLCTAKRKAAKTETERQFWKLVRLKRM